MTAAPGVTGFGRDAALPERYDFWVVDLDGTLVDVDREHVHSVLERVGDWLGCTFTDREAEVLWYGFGEARGMVLDRHGIDPGRFWQVFNAVEDPDRRASATYFCEDATAVGELDGPVALLTHCPESLARPVLRRYDIGDWFDTVVCCTDETGWKPDPKPVRKTLNGLGVRSDRPGALVGDGPGDVGAAWNAGLAGVHVRRHDPGRSEQCVLADHRIDDLEALRG
ncbi:MAG: HAD family hydrolase [Halobacteriales archaeon]